MNRQESPKHPLRGNSGGNTLKEDRYYVQRLTDQVFVIRERLSVDGEPGPNDRFVRAFDFREDAYLYVHNVNDKQRRLDEQYGHWEQRAI